MQLLFPTYISFFLIDKLHGSASLFCNQLTSCVLSFSDKINNLIVSNLKELDQQSKISRGCMNNELYLLVLQSLPFYTEQTGVTNVLEVTRCTGCTRHLPIVSFYQLSAVFHVYCVKFVNEGFNLRLSLHAGNNSSFFLLVDMILLFQEKNQSHEESTLKNAKFGSFTDTLISPCRYQIWTTKTIVDKFFSPWDSVLGFGLVFIYLSGFINIWWYLLANEVVF